MKHIAILFAVSLLFVGCTPQAVKDTHKATQIAQEDFANNAELVLEKVIDLYRHTETKGIEMAYNAALDNDEKAAGQDVKKYRALAEAAYNFKVSKLQDMEIEIKKIRAKFAEAKIDLEGSRMLNEALGKYLNAKKVDPAQATELIEMILNKVIKKKDGAK